MKKIDFINQPTRQALFLMVLPLMAAMILNMAYNLVDSLWIGNLMGERAMAALATSTPLILLLNSFAMGATNGLGILLSHAVGAQNKKRQSALLATSSAAALGGCLLLTAGAEAMLPALLRLLGAEAAVLPMASSYLRIYLMGYPLVFFYFYFTAVLRSHGNSTFQALGMLLCTLLNGVLDPLCIRLGGLAGAAAATLLSQGVAVVLMILYLKRRHCFPCTCVILAAPSCASCAAAPCPPWCSRASLR